MKINFQLTNLNDKNDMDFLLNKFKTTDPFTISLGPNEHTVIFTGDLFTNTTQEGHVEMSCCLETI